jgi:hypothetical protein
MQQGGAIKKPTKKSKKKNPKVEEALETQMQGGKLKKKSPVKFKFHDPMHKYLHQNLSGRGGNLDTPFVRDKMYSLMSRYHPSIFQSYLSGKVRDIPQDPQYHLGGPVQQTRPDPRPHVVDYGGSMNALTHSENGLLQSYDSTFYNQILLI